MSIVILGAGIAGLACADALVTAGHAVTLFDKGRAPGGRMATRRIATEAGEAFFDHGAQYFTARDPDFRSQVLRWQAAGLAAPWPVAGPEAWVGTPSMAAPVRAMAEAHDVRFPVQIDAIVREESQWHVDGAAFDILAITLPAEQAATLLRPVQPGSADLAAQTPAAPCCEAGPRSGWQFWNACGIAPKPPKVSGMSDCFRLSLLRLLKTGIDRQRLALVANVRTRLCTNGTVSLGSSRLLPILLNRI